MAPTIDPLFFALTLLFSLSIQIGTNFANDAFDFINGADTFTRIGPKRAVFEKWIAPKTMKNAALGTFACAPLIALPLMIFAGWWSFPLALLAIFSGFFYTGGKKPLGYIGLGEILVFIFFGPIAVCGTFFLQTKTFTYPVLFAGIAPGLLSCSILIANNLRDEQTDKIANKQTLIVRFGSRFGRWEYAATLVGAAAIPLLLTFYYHAHWSLLSAALILPLSLPLIQKTFRASHPLELLPLLPGSVLLLTLYTLLFCFTWHPLYTATT